MTENQNTEEPKVEETIGEPQLATTSQEGYGEVVAPRYKGFLGKVDKFYGITKMKSSFKTEIVAGCTTFMTMVYILMVHPNMFTETGEVSYGAMYIVTALSAIVGTLLMSFLAKIPFAQAPGMGLNAFFVYTICMTMGYTYAQALLIVLFSGFLFLFLTIIGARKAIVRAVPACIRVAISAGIGLFVAFVGLQNAGLIVPDAGTGVALVSFNLRTFTTDGATMIAAAISIASLIIIAIFSKLNFKASIVLGIVGSALMYYACCGIGVAVGSESCKAVFTTISEEFNLNPFVAFQEFGTQAFGQVFKNGFTVPSNMIFDFIAALVAFAMVDMFDTLGSLMGACQAAGKESGLIDEKGEVKNIQRALLSDSIATCTGAILGTSTVTTFVESASGVAVGGRTGMTALVVAVLFAVAMFLSPIAALIPSCATAGALVYVGVLMMRNVIDIDWKDPATAVPAFLTIAVMSFAYSISYGIAAGFISYTLIKLCTGKIKEISPVTAVHSLVFIFTFLFTH